MVFSLSQEGETQINLNSFVPGAFRNSIQVIIQERLSFEGWRERERIGG
jgi:hypothetical protein